MIFLDDACTFLVARSRRGMLDALLDRLGGEHEPVSGAQCLGGVAAAPQVPLNRKKRPRTMMVWGRRGLSADLVIPVVIKRGEQVLRSAGEIRRNASRKPPIQQPIPLPHMLLQLPEKGRLPRRQQPGRLDWDVR